jgi:hypothetical protein
VPKEAPPVASVASCSAAAAGSCKISPKNAPPPCVSASVPSASSIHCSKTSSTCAATSGLFANSTKAPGRISFMSPTITRSGLASSATAVRLVAASFKTAPNRFTFPRNASVVLFSYKKRVSVSISKQSV